MSFEAMIKPFIRAAFPAGLKVKIDQEAGRVLLMSNGQVKHDLSFEAIEQRLNKLFDSS